MNMFETNIFIKPESFSIDRATLEHNATEFLTHAREYIDDEIYEDILSNHETRSKEIVEAISTVTDGKKVVTYDKYKGFMVNGVPATMGQIIAARHLDPTIALPEELGNAGLGKKLRKTYLEKAINDELYDAINYKLAAHLAVVSEEKNIAKSVGYRQISERLKEGSNNEQLGVIAESIMQGFAEMIAVDRPDLGISVMPANAYQDVEDKVDFIITTTTKRRGADIEVKDPLSNEKHVGIQFTINTSKEAHKKEQIAKAKERGVEFDDIVYVAIDSKTIREAIESWKANGKPLSGVWGELSKPAKIETIKALFHSMITPEQEESLLKAV